MLTRSLHAPESPTMSWQGSYHPASDRQTHLRCLAPRENTNRRQKAGPPPEWWCDEGYLLACGGGLPLHLSSLKPWWTNKRWSPNQSPKALGLYLLTLCLWYLHSNSSKEKHPSFVYLRAKTITLGKTEFLIEERSIWAPDSVKEVSIPKSRCSEKE